MKDFIFTDHIVLENERVRLEPLNKAHLHELKGIIQKDAGLMKFSTTRVEGEEGLQHYIDIALNARKEGIRYPFAIYDKQANAYAGSTSYNCISNVDGRLEIGYTWIGYDFQKTGLNRAMKFLMLQYAFETLGFQRVEFRADSRNVQSRTAMAKIGATYEGELRSYIVLPDGFRRSTVYYSILPDEWAQIKRERFANQEQRVSSFTEIRNSTQADIEEIFSLYRIATKYMQERSPVFWPEFDREMVENEINENCQWKMMDNGKLTCIWATTTQDPDIWEERNEDPSVYIHRIATAPEYRGKGFVNDIVSWAKVYAKENGKQFIRLDTVGNNKKLIAHYTACGFNFLGLKTLKDVSSLPSHYSLGPACLFEMSV